MAKAILNKIQEKFISKKLLCLVVGIGLELSGVGIGDNLLLLMCFYLSGQSIIDVFSAFRR